MSDSDGVADRDEIARRVTGELGTPPPDALLDVWTGVAVNEHDAFVVYGPDEIADLNADYHIADWRPDLLLIGSEGDIGLFVPRGRPDPHARLIDLGSVSIDEGIDVGPLSAVAADGFRSLPFDPPPLDWPYDMEPTDRVDVLLTCRPDAGTRALFEIRRTLGSDLPVHQLVAPDAGFPVRLLHAVPFGRYNSRIEDLDGRYGCLEVRPAGDS